MHAVWKVWLQGSDSTIVPSFNGCKQIMHSGCGGAGVGCGGAGFGCGGTDLGCGGAAFVKGGGLAGEEPKFTNRLKRFV